MYWGELAEAEGASFEELKGKTIIETRGLKEGSGHVVFITADKEEYVLWHYQDCCEVVYLEGIHGDPEHLLHTPILMAEVVTDTTEPPIDEWDVSHTWTFYKLATQKGYVTLRWYGSSNGWYSETVDFSKRR